MLPLLRYIPSSGPVARALLFFPASSSSAFAAAGGVGTTAAPSGSRQRAKVSEIGVATAARHRPAVLFPARRHNEYRRDGPEASAQEAAGGGRGPAGDNSGGSGAGRRATGTGVVEPGPRPAPGMAAPWSGRGERFSRGAAGPSTAGSGAQQPDRGRAGTSEATGAVGRRHQGQRHRTIVPDSSSTYSFPDGILPPARGTSRQRRAHGQRRSRRRRRPVRQTPPLDVSGGTITGDEFKGTVLTSRLDYELTLSNGAMELEEVRSGRRATTSPFSCASAVLPPQEIQSFASSPTSRLRPRLVCLARRHEARRHAYG